MTAVKHLFIFTAILLTAMPASALTDIYLIYPKSWCDADRQEPLHFTMAELGVSEVYGVSSPKFGRVYLDSSQGGYYLPECDGLTRLGFDVFQVIGVDRRVGVGVVLDDGFPQEEHEVEAATDGLLGPGWSLTSDPGASAGGIALVNGNRKRSWKGATGFASIPTPSRMPICRSAIRKSTDFSNPRPSKATARMGYKP